MDLLQSARPQRSLSDAPPVYGHFSFTVTFIPSALDNMAMYAGKLLQHSSVDISVVQLFDLIVNFEPVGYKSIH